MAARLVATNHTARRDFAGEAQPDLTLCSSEYSAGLGASPSQPPSEQRGKGRCRAFW